ncbi:hypothetical protein [Sphingobium yanoikuyae]|uniref:Uncharacterized protein n=1 Tax=Sphingobium yanoikuyae TaxID=13690 RepID=A0A430BWV7_SPHYA|nr:hypothetical protein [Sphingobium yanoikuyae]RSU57209.1 hypothetical protein DAH51_10375 [Sphingobium yanoikuyae]
MRFAIPPALFLPAWSTAAVAAGVQNVQPSAQAIMHIAWLGLDVPVVSAILAVLGVVLARPIAPKGPAPLTVWQTFCVYALTALLLLAWVIERRPGFLFAFVMSIGLSFSILSVLEAIGDQAREFFSRLTAVFNPRGGSDA